MSRGGFRPLVVIQTQQRGLRGLMPTRGRPSEARRGDAGGERFRCQRRLSKSGPFGGEPGLEKRPDECTRLAFGERVRQRYQSYGRASIRSIIDTPSAPEARVDLGLSEARQRHRRSWRYLWESLPWWLVAAVHTLMWNLVEQWCLQRHPPPPQFPARPCAAPYPK